LRLYARQNLKIILKLHGYNRSALKACIHCSINLTGYISTFARGNFSLNEVMTAQAEFADEKRNAIYSTPNTDR
jgi:hypothetical protein